MRILSILSLVIIVVTKSAGQHSLQGRVTGQDKHSLGLVAVSLSENADSSLTLNTLTNQGGAFRFNVPHAGQYRVLISALGYETQKKTIQINGTVDLGTTVLREKAEELAEVTVTGNAGTQAKREQPIMVEVFDLKKSHLKSSTLPQLLNLSSGIKVRQSAGVGSETTLNLNGLQGKAIRFFKDGISTDYLGRAFNLSLIPSNTIEQIEVYKGVLPTALGSDALGGGVNFVSADAIGTHLNASYGLGSFGTHEFTLNGRAELVPDKFFMSTSSYYIRSLNNYRIDAQVTNPDTRNRENVRVRRFHDEVSSLYLSGKVGVRPTRLLDQATLEVGFLDYSADVQHNLYMSKPYGEATLAERMGQANLTLEKKVENRYDWQLFAGTSVVNNYFTDTTRNQYDWHGQIVGVASTYGEVNGIETRQHLRDTNVFGRAVANVHLHEDHILQFSHNLLLKERVGGNPTGQKIVGTEIDPLTIPAHYRKNVTGLGLSSAFFSKKITHVLTVKRYQIATSGVDMLYSYDTDPTTSTQGNFGFSSSVKYQLRQGSFARLSFENATRIPDAEEYFGDGFSVRGNLDLQPERSNNLNANFVGYLAKSGRNKIDFNFFLRDQKNLIVLVPWLPFGSYENWASAKVLGAELSNSGQLGKHLAYTLNLTYQDLRRTGITNASEKLLLGARIPNIPYLFGNASLNYNRPNVLAQGDFLNLYFSYAYTHDYYLLAVPRSLEPKNIFSKGSIQSDLIIPTQHVVDGGVTYGFAKLPLVLNAEVNNLLNASLYDRFRVQRPGTNFRLKLTYQFTKNNS